MAADTIEGKLLQSCFMFNPGNSNAEEARSFFRNERVKDAMDREGVDNAIDFFVDNNLVLDIVSS